MEIEKMEMIVINVKNMEESVKLFSDILGTTFVDISRGIVPREEEAFATEEAKRSFGATKRRVFIDRRGFMELLESTPPVEKEGVIAVHFKVRNLEEAKIEMKQKGVPLLAEVKVGALKEAIYEDTHGVRLCFIEYGAPTMVDANLQK